MFKQKTLQNLFFFLTWEGISISLNMYPIQKNVVKKCM